MMPYFAAVEVLGKHGRKENETHVPSSISNKIMIFMLRHVDDENKEEDV